VADRLARTQVFFATPHHIRGPDGGKILTAHILHAVGKHKTRTGLLGVVRDALQPVHPSPSVIQELQLNSANLTITRNFLTAQKWLKIAIVNFIEDTVTKGLDVVVSSSCRFLLDVILLTQACT
jgi:hypothetical protein